MDYSSPDWDYSHIPADSSRDSISKTFRLSSDIARAVEDAVEGPGGFGFRNHSQFFRWATVNGLAYLAQISSDREFKRKINVALAKERSEWKEKEYEDAEALLVSLRKRLDKAERARDRELIQEVLSDTRQAIEYMRFAEVRAGLQGLIEKYR